MIRYLAPLSIFFSCATVAIELKPVDTGLMLVEQDKSLLVSPEEGFWSIGVNATGLANMNFQHAGINSVRKQGDWSIYEGRLSMAGGEWQLRDSCIEEQNRIKCIRRFEWQGQASLDDVVLSVRWQAPSAAASTFLPGLVYYGNPAAKKQDPSRIAHLSGKPGEFVQFEEHRFPMPFAHLEWQHQGWWGAALHTLPSPIMGGKRPDLWWSLGTLTAEKHTEMRLLSGPIGYNGEADVAKLYQKASAPYPHATITVNPGDVIEKTYYLQGYAVENQGHGFAVPMYSAMDIFKPYETSAYPHYQDIVSSKLQYNASRWLQGAGYAGFNMFDHDFRKRIVMGWAGQSDAPGYYLLAMGEQLARADLIDQAQQTLDFLTSAPFDPEQGFALRFDVANKTWSHYDHVSQGQALYMFAKAIERGRTMSSVDTSKWEAFFLQGADFHASKILSDDWYPLSTNQGFLVAPLALGARLFDNPRLGQAALKAADHYAARHLSMQEPYWGGTLDAKGEDKEGAWAGFQAFMAAYELSGESNYLHYAQHAADVMLSYTVIWDIPMPAGRLADHYFKSTGWTAVSPQNQHLDVYGVVTTPWLYRLAELTNNTPLKQLAKVMYVSCGQLIAPNGDHGEQIQQTNFVQSHVNIERAGDNPDPSVFRGGYSEDWTVLWITAHFLTAASLFEEMEVQW